ncbi:MAG: hypothetical protein KF773_17670 [Deltaproteobacteria bacterium]|nr:hypothetical protein [Deltaproteobacteria bacterium]
MTPAWATGTLLYRALRRIDARRGASSWDEALAWLATLREPIDELQYWGHGTWGAALVAGDALDAAALAPAHRLRAGLDALRAQLAPDALVWFRTCETLGARPGMDFAMRLADFLGARVAGHTYIIHAYQSGLCGVAPGMTTHWSPDEGLLEGTPDQPRRARSSTPWAPRTIHCLNGRVPEAWFSRSETST